MDNFQEGVYLEEVVQEIGTGGTARTQKIKNYYLAQPKGPDNVEIQLLDINGDPLPIKNVVPQADFTNRFVYQPDFKRDERTPKQKTVDKAIAQAEAHVRRKEYNSAEFEYGKALKLDEENVRANFGVAKVYLATGEADKAKDVFEKLAHIDAVFEEKNKHVFNELGIELRRLGLHDQAIAHYTKALSFTKDDENLYFNAARAYYEKGLLKEALGYLKKALTINRNLTEAIKLLEAIKKAS